MLPFLVPVQRPQDLSEHLPGAFRLAVCAEAITELPRFVIELCPMPLKTLHRTIPQDEEVGSARLWHPSLVCERSRRVHACQSPLTCFEKRGCTMG